MAYFEHNSDTRNFDDLVGKVVRSENMVLLGRISEIIRETDGYGHVTSYVLLDSGQKINCRTLEV